MSKLFLKYCIAVIFLSVFVIANSQIIEKLDRDQIKLKNVKSQQTFEYEVVKGKQASKGVLTKELQFDLQGNLVKQINFKRDNSVLSVLVYKYDDKGNKTQYEKYIGPQDSLNYKQNIKFDSKGKRVAEKGFDGLDSFKVVYNYNKYNKMAEAIYYTKNVVDEKRIFSYDGNITNIKVNNGKGVYQYSLQNVYNTDNKIIEENRVDKDKVITMSTKFEYSPKKLLLSETKYVKGKVVERTLYVYNNKDLLVEIWQEDDKGVKFQSGKNSYSDAGSLLEEQFRKNKDSEYSKSTYKYNDKGLCNSVESYFATYKFQTLSVYTYDFY